PASIFRNNLAQRKYLRVKFDGPSGNKFGVGANATVYAGGSVFFGENYTVRGWQSSVEPIVHFGLDSLERIDSLVVEWPGGKRQVLRDVVTGSTLTVNFRDAALSVSPLDAKRSPLITQQDRSLYQHKEDSYVAFNAEKLIPHMLSAEGPRISIGDVNGDKRDDFFIGGAAGQAGGIFVQDAKGEFVRDVQQSLESDRAAEDIGSVFLDADNNGTLDLVVVSGGQEFSGNDERLMPRLYKNDGRGNFSKAKNALPNIFVNASCVKASDIDNDGDQDLFIGGRVVSGRYGIDPMSYILVNDGRGVFTDHTKEWLPGSKGELGMVSDAAWIDLNVDGKSDLILVGEWMPATIFIQDSTKRLVEKTGDYGLGGTSGWWNCLTVEDFDKDGDQDFVAGNYGLNSRLRASPQEPVEIYIGDIDGNGSLDQIMTRFNQGKKYPFISRDQLVKQVPSFKKKFLKYQSFANVSIDDILSKEQQRGFVTKKAEFLASAYFENTGSGGFEIHPLPTLAQV
ncbi:MAG TPA: FG-GAP-like repeat-containing protein, partial [Sphingobacteriaceae bacterium]